MNDWVEYYWYKAAAFGLAIAAAAVLFSDLPLKFVMIGTPPIALFWALDIGEGE